MRCVHWAPALLLLSPPPLAEALTNPVGLRYTPTGREWRAAALNPRRVFERHPNRFGRRTRNGPPPTMGASLIQTSEVVVNSLVGGYWGLLNSSLQR